MNPEENKIFLCVWLLYCVYNFSDSRMEVRRYQRTDINGFNVVLKKFSVGYKV